MSADRRAESAYTESVTRPAHDHAARIRSRFTANRRPPGEATMRSVLDLLTSGVHDAKNRLFIAESAVVRAEVEHDIRLDDARFAIEQAALRLSRVLTAYRAERDLLALDVSMTLVADLVDEAVLVNGAHCHDKGLALEVMAPDAGLQWPLDRELMLDVLSNALQNAARFAHTRIRLAAKCGDGGLVLSVEDDGPGFDTTDAREMSQRGLGLFVAREIARRHRRADRTGRLELSNGGLLGGAVFRLTLP
jgi:signal transduction histidine kinase